MKKKIFVEATTAFAQHAQNMRNPQLIQIASLLCAYAVDHDPLIEQRILDHPKGSYAAEWIEVHINEPERHSLASAFWLACMTLETAEEFGSPVDVERARRKLNSVIAAQSKRGYR